MPWISKRELEAIKTKLSSYESAINELRSLLSQKDDIIELQRQEIDSLRNHTIHLADQNLKLIDSIREMTMPNHSRPSLPEPERHNVEVTQEELDVLLGEMELEEDIDENN